MCEPKANNVINAKCGAIRLHNPIQYTKLLLFNSVFSSFSFACCHIWVILKTVNLHVPQKNSSISVNIRSIFRYFISAVYTGIKKPESFSHSGFSLKVARQLPLNTKKKTNRKTTSAAWFFETPPKFHWFFANVNARSNLAGIIRVFGHVVRDLQRNHPTAARDVMRTTRVRSKVERSHACAPLTKTQVWDSGFFAHALFVPKTPNVMGFSGSVNGTTKNPGFLDFGFCQCKWAYCHEFHHTWNMYFIQLTCLWNSISCLFCTDMLLLTISANVTE